jgi:outer membrane biosynthesis protein TonB
MTRAVVFLTAILLLASLGAVAQNNSSPSGGQGTSVQATAPAQNAPAAPPPNAPAANTATGTTTPPQSKGIEATTQGKEPRTTSSAELPQTSTILPLLGLLGLGSLVAGLFARR